ncbi:MAG: C-GCAxxG-C-C family protein [Verrucomicrobiia bacterium]
MEFNKVQIAVSRFKTGYNCSQSVFSTYSENSGIPYEAACKLSSALGGGIGRQAKTCGALTGAALVIGLYFGNSRPEDKMAKERVYNLVRQLFERFNSIHHYTDCKDLLGIDISNPENFKKAHELGIIKTKCPDFVRSASEILENIIKENL